MLWTFHLVCLSWLFFRAGTLGGALAYLQQVVTLGQGTVSLGSIVLVLLTGLAVLALDLVQRNSGRHDEVLRWSESRRGLVYGVAIAAIVVFSGGSPVPFIYFQF
jgi:hypothetical protein